LISGKVPSLIKERNTHPEFRVENLPQKGEKEGKERYTQTVYKEKKEPQLLWDNSRRAPPGGTNRKVSRHIVWGKDGKKKEKKYNKLPGK